MMKTPKKSLHDMIFQSCLDITDNVFRYLPNSETKYPFVHISDSSNQDIENNDLLGEVTQNINIWSTERQINLSDELLFKIHDKLRQIKGNDNYSFNLINFNDMEMIDTSTGSRLIHVVIRATFNYIKN